MEIEYLETMPDPALRPWVDHYWSFRTTGEEEELTPEQCCIQLGKPEFMAHLYGKPSKGLLHGKWVTFPQAYFTGISLGPMMWHMQGSACMVGVCLKPEGALHLLGLPLAAICDGYGDARDHMLPLTWKRVQPALARHDPGEALSGLEKLLLEVLERIPEPNDRFITALRRIREQGVRWDKQALYECLFVGDRQMQRLFKERLGLSPRAYFKIMRFQEAYNATRDHKQVDWMGLVTLLGYSDQPHLIRDFKRFAGSSPQGFMQQPLPRFQRPALAR
ncbi:MAG TPA: helix-turn-helix domain-containing protein [Flavobacteriales bacterium]|nr:helix-turn-helix domain-containing protein [Flavobacteriales bacterium]